MPCGIAHRAPNKRMVAKEISSEPNGVGLEVHESPFMNRDCPLIIEKGCVITVEPGIYIPDWGGVRIEDDVVLTDDGLKILNSSAKELLEL